MEQDPKTPNVTPEPQAPPAPAPAEPAPAEPAASAVEPAAPKKKKGGLIAVIIIVLLVIGGAIVAILLLSGSNDVKKATSKFFDTLTAITSPEDSKVENKNLKVDGKIELSSEAEGQKMNMEMKLGLEANDHSDARIYLGLNNISLSGLNIDKTIDAEVRSFAGKTTYLKFGGLDELASILSVFLGSQAASAFDTINNTWLKIEASDLSGGSIEGLDDSSIKCLSEADTSKISDLFSEKELSKVFTLEKYTGNEEKVNSGTLYTLEMNKEAAKEFIKKVEEEFNNLKKTCNLPVTTSTPTFTESKAEDLSNIYVVINKNEVSRMFTKISSDGATASINLDFSYPKSLDIEEPKDAEPIKDVLDEFSGIISGLGSGGETTTCKSGYSYDYFSGECIPNDNPTKCGADQYYSYTYNKCVDAFTDPTEYDPIVNDLYDYLIEEDDDEMTANIPEGELKGIINDLVVCLNDAGVNVDSVESIESLDEDDEEVAECSEQFSNDLFELAMDYYDY